MTDTSLNRLGFIASTGRTATTFIAKILGDIDGVTALHEGHYLSDKQLPIIPPINIEHRKAWNNAEFCKMLVLEKRSKAILESATEDSSSELLVDVAYYNAALVNELSALHPAAHFIVIYRRCESFVRSATTMLEEDLMPVGWPDDRKPLSPREKFIELGRLKPRKGSPELQSWNEWSAIKKNIWLWKTTNHHLADFVDNGSSSITALRFEMLAEDPTEFWKQLLSGLNLLSDQALEYCTRSSENVVNAKSGGYQIAGASHWSPQEIAYLKEAQTLEKQLYGE